MNRRRWKEGEELHRCIRFRACATFVLIKGEELDELDPRYKKTFELIAYEIKRSGWRRKDVTIARLQRGLRLHVTQLRFIMAGIRLSVGLAIIGIVVGEFSTAISGLGGMIVEYAN